MEFGVGKGFLVAICECHLRALVGIGGGVCCWGGGLHRETVDVGKQEVRILRFWGVDWGIPSVGCSFIASCSEGFGQSGIE